MDILSFQVGRYLPLTLSWPFMPYRSKGVPIIVALSSSGASSVMIDPGD